MMDAVRRHPADGTTLQSQGPADRQEILDPLRRPIGAVREQSMVTHPNAQAPRHPPQKQRKRQRLPTEYEQGNDGADVEQAKKQSDGQIEGLGKGSVTFENT
jgi:hypothetical protein